MIQERAIQPMQLCTLISLFIAVGAELFAFIEHGLKGDYWKPFIVYFATAYIVYLVSYKITEFIICTFFVFMLPSRSFLLNEGELILENTSDKEKAFWKKQIPEQTEVRCLPKQVRISEDFPMIDKNLCNRRITITVRVTKLRGYHLLFFNNGLDEHITYWLLEFRQLQNQLISELYNQQDKKQQRLLDSALRLYLLTNIPSIKGAEIEAWFRLK